MKTVILQSFKIIVGQLYKIAKLHGGHTARYVHTL